MLGQPPPAELETGNLKEQGLHITKGDIIIHVQNDLLDHQLLGIEDAHQLRKGDGHRRCDGDQHHHEGDCVPDSSGLPAGGGGASESPALQQAIQLTMVKWDFQPHPLTTVKLDLLLIWYGLQVAPNWRLVPTSSFWLGKGWGCVA